MKKFKVLIVGGTHGNEINASWLINQWNNRRININTFGIDFEAIIGNPKALDFKKRYIDKDLNRCFTRDILNTKLEDNYENRRAKEILRIYGDKGINACKIAIDLHSTTAVMGSCLVVYGRRPSDLALAALIQFCLGLPIYLHEGDISQTGFLVESWPCGLVVEIGPVPQLLIDTKVIKKNHLIIESLFRSISEVINGTAVYPHQIVIHRHIKSIDFPRDKNGLIEAYLHPQIAGKDWMPIQNHQNIFLKANGETVKLDLNSDELYFPVFINEAAYAEKHIAMSITKKEVLKFSPEWKQALCDLIKT